MPHFSRLKKIQFNQFCHQLQQSLHSLRPTISASVLGAGLRIAALGALGALTTLAAPAAHADVLIENANGYTLNQAQQLQRFSALVFDDNGKILAVGHSTDLLAQFPHARRINMGGKTLLPGMIDAHGHTIDLGIGATQLNLRNTDNLKEAQQAIADYAKRNPKQRWLLGGAWNQAIWKLGRFPTAQEIDAVVKDRPVWLGRIDGHAGWANSKALQMAGINRDTPDPQGGKIEKDAQGNPTGILVDNAMELIDKIVPMPSEAEQRVALDAALQQLTRFGLTSIHDAGVSAEADKLFRNFADQGKLAPRVVGMISDTTEFFERVSATAPAPLLSYADDHYSLRAVKLYADGALGSRGAALLAPYSDAPHNKGLLFHSADEIYQMMAKAANKGYQVNVHAIGDAGNRQILDSFEKLAHDPAVKQFPDLRHRIEHAQVVALSDIPRFVTLNVIPSMQPTHATSDMNMAEDRVGHERIAGAYAWRTFLQQGSRIACGSDFPIESPNPFWGMHAAVTRQDKRDLPQNGWYADQAMTVTEAFRCFTLDAAYAGHQENVLGSLESGKWADFIVVDRDLFRIRTKDIYKIRVLQTWVGGKRVYLNK